MRLRVWLVLVPVLLLAFWLGARSLDADAIWLDEYFSLYDAGAGPYGPLTPAENWSRVAGRNPWHAPGFFILLNGWGRLVGYEPAAQRAFSLLFGVLTIATTYQLGCTLISRRVGLYGAAILATSAFFIYYTHEIRMYTLIAFLTVATMLVYFRLLRWRGFPPVWMWSGWFGLLFAVVYTHYLAVVPLLALGLYHVLFARKDRRWWQMSGLALLAGLAFLPWAQNLISGLGLAAEAETLHNRALSSRRLLELVLTLFGNGSLSLVVVAGVIALTDRRRVVWRVLFFALVPLALFVLFNRVASIIPETRIRYLLSLWPLFALIVGVALLRLQRWPVLPVLALAVWGGLGLYSASTASFVSMLASAGYVFPLHLVDDLMRQQSSSGDALVYYLSDDMAKITYERQADFYTRWRGLDAFFVEPRATDDERAVVRDNVVQSVEGHTRFWLAYVPSDIKTGLPTFRDQLSASYEECGTVLDSDSLIVELFISREHGCNSVFQASAQPEANYFSD